MNMVIFMEMTNMGGNHEQIASMDPQNFNRAHAQFTIKELDRKILWTTLQSL